MANLLEPNREETKTKLSKYSILIVPAILLIIDAFFVRREGDYIIIGDTVLEVRDILLLFVFAISLIALLRPMDQKKYQQH